MGPDLGGKEAYHGFRNGVLFTGPKGQLVADYNNYKLLPEEKFKDFTPPATDHRALDRPPQGMDRGDQRQRRHAVQLRL